MSPLVSATSDVRPSLLLLGDSRERDLHKLMVPHVCADDWEGFWWTAPAVQDSTVAGGAVCRASSQFSRIGYFLHYGVSPEG
eukprot:7379825-Prymnesium_polylepis.1